MKKTKQILPKSGKKQVMSEEDLKPKTTLSKKQVLRSAELIHRFRNIGDSAKLKSDALQRTSYNEEGEPKDPYDYDNLVHVLGKEIGDYKAYALGPYLHINFLGKRAPRELAAPIDRRAALFAMHTALTGWKLHISVEPTQVSKAWSLIYPILMAHKVTGIKVLDPVVLARKIEEGDEARAEVSCKQFTIYQFQNKAINAVTWLEIMQEIEDALQSHAVGQGDRPLANNAIAGSQYFSYRNDTHPMLKKYISDKAAECYVVQYEHEAPGLRAFNLINAPDPFEAINLHENCNRKNPCN